MIHIKNAFIYDTIRISLEKYPIGAIYRYRASDIYDS